MPCLSETRVDADGEAAEAARSDTPVPGVGFRPATSSESGTGDMVRMARTLLGLEPETGDVAHNVFLSDLLAHAAMPGAQWSAPVGQDLVAEALQWSREGVDVVLAAAHDLGHVVVHHFASGSLLDTRELPDNVFSLSRLREWRAQFPRRYGTVDGGPDHRVFFETMEQFRPGVALARPTLFVLDAELASLPPNLMMSGGNFCGDRVPVGAAPSLEWLRLVRSRPLGALAGPFAALPAGPLVGGDLGAVIAAACRDHGIQVVGDNREPDERAALAIVTVQAMTRPGNTSAVPAINAEVVLVFDHDAGNQDNACADGAVSLARDLLGSGASAVLTSPWPVHKDVIACWLPAFLDAWLGGATLLVSNFTANAEVSKQIGDDPVHCLAMTVYGHALLRAGKPS